MSSHPRRKQKKDNNQDKLVSDILSFPGFSVVVGHDDLIIGGPKNGVPTTLWVEVKTEECYSKKTGELLESAKTPSQKKLDETFSGARIYCKSSKDVFDWFGIILR